VPDNGRCTWCTGYRWPVVFCDVSSVNSLQNKSGGGLGDPLEPDSHKVYSVALAIAARAIPATDTLSASVPSCSAPFPSLAMASL